VIHVIAAYCLKSWCWWPIVDFILWAVLSWEAVAGMIDLVKNLMKK